MVKNLLGNCEVYGMFDDTGTTGAAASTYTDGYNTIDMSNYDSAICTLVVSNITAAGAVGLIPLVGDSSASLVACTDAAEIAYVAETTAAHDRTVLALEVANPSHRWLSFRYHRATQASFGMGSAIAFNAKNMPVTPSTTLCMDYQLAVTPTT